MKRRGHILSFAGTIVLAACSGGGSSSSVPVALTQHIAAIAVSGTPTIVFDHVRDKQEPYNLPDAQATAWKEADGTVNLMIPSFENYRMRGPDLLHLTMDTKKIYSSSTSGSSIPEDQHDYDHWLLGPYSQDGVHWYSLAHTEWYACLLNGDCAQTGANGLGADTNSWANTVNSFVSTNGGASWSLNTVNGNHAPADVSYHWTGSVALNQRVYLQALNHTGMFGPSRLVQEGGYWYSVATYIHRDFTQLDPAHGLYEAPIDNAGYVLIRTSDFTNPNGWQVWGGGSVYNPVASLQFLAFFPQSNGTSLNAAAPQLIHDTVSGSFLLIFTVFGGVNPVYFMTSPSLAAPVWTDAKPIAGSATLISDPAGPVTRINPWWFSQTFFITSGMPSSAKEGRVGRITRQHRSIPNRCCTALQRKRATPAMS